MNSVPTCDEHYVNFGTRNIQKLVLIPSTNQRICKLMKVVQIKLHLHKSQRQKSLHSKNITLDTRKAKTAKKQSKQR